ncbi:carbohydrate ABC transporter permease [Anaerocolumna sp.]|uniref:carbohydrate ABC transporter permease n=1 Tax=Anaerocolumna sp. TaxID=2041569 RepID=UPI0028B13C6E|nr:carbohydrate ABC transporter permease [Anaerocolumna sp.]
MFRNKTIKKSAFAVLAFLICLFMVIPLYIIIKISFGTSAEILTQHPTLLPHSFTLEHWKGVLESGNLWGPFSKSLMVATTTMIIAIIVVAPASYAISRLNKGLIMAHLIGQMPFMAWILVSTFSAIPKELEEAAEIDGANRMRTLLDVIFPVAMQGIAVSGLYVWLNSWNEFTYALYLSLSTKTLPLGVYYYVQRGGFFQQAAYATILAIPVIIITFILQRYLKSGYLSGAVKG